MTHATHGERIAALEANDKHTREGLRAIMTQLSKMQEHMDERFDKIETRLTAQETKLAAYENKGKGVLIGVGLFGASIGAGLLVTVERIAEAFR